MFHNLIQKYRYGGDLETYKNSLLKTLFTRYYTGFSGGVLEYLDKWEDAAIRFDNIAPKEKTSSDAKRTNFGAQFTVINDTDFLIEQVRDTTDTWDEMANSLRTKLERRTELSKETSTKEARIKNARLDKDAHDMAAIKHYIFNVKRFTKKEDWNIGYNLWEALTQDQRDLLINIRGQARGPRENTITKTRKVM